MMKKVVVPIQAKETPIHDGHREVIEFAKQFGDVTVRITPPMSDTCTYLLEGRVIKKDIDTSLLLDSIQKLGIKHRLPKDVEWGNRERWRQSWLKKATNLIELYKDSLILDRYIKQATALTVAAYMKSGGKPEEDVTVMGPEIAHFFLKNIGKLFNSAPLEIYPRIIKDKNTKLKAQGALSHIAPTIAEELYQMVKGAQEYYKVGSNKELVKELQAAYKGRKEFWTLEDITVFEGKFYGGRIEITGFRLPIENGIWLIEEVEYFV